MSFDRLVRSCAAWGVMAGLAAAAAAAAAAVAAAAAAMLLVAVLRV